MRAIRGVLIAILALSTVVIAAARRKGGVAWAVHVSLGPTRLDPAETAGTITPYMVLYALRRW
jgi:hypothetical protein